MELRNTPRVTDTAPPIRRASMTPRPWVGVAAALRSRALGTGDGEGAQPRPAGAAEPAWRLAARRRRAALMALVFGATALAVGLMAAGEPEGQRDVLWVLHLALFGVLFAWVTAGFATAAMGAWAVLRGDIHTPTPTTGPIDAGARTAIVMPICNEDIATVFGGLRSTCASLAATGASQLFDVFVLSDTSNPALRAAELRAWQELRESLGGNARVYYRWRRRRTKRKAGNVADFCRRWGANYRYMVVLDADSVMGGDCLVSLVRMMEANPRAGIVQSLPRACGHDTLHARAQQFLGRVAGRLFAAGLSYWQLGESHYWGHNAIIRVQPFMQHCALAPIPGKGGLAGEIMSHDFVEAALMRRAGYEVWLVDLPGSYEQQPPHLLDELQRDRRWCQGNLQNAQLIAEPGFQPVHRVMLASGALSYGASPLWLAFVVLGIVRWFAGPEGGTSALPAAAPALWAVTLAMLFLPRVLGLAVVMQRKETAQFGGLGRLATGAVLEGALATLQAPLRMLAHTLFVLGSLTGLKLDWKSPSRDATDVRWREALGRFGMAGALVAMGVAIAIASDAGSMVARLAPLWLPLLMAAPLCVWTSRVGPGAWLRRQRVWLIPEEARVPALLQRNWPTPIPAVVPSAVPARPAPVARPRRPVRARSLMPAFGRGMLVVARGAALAAVVAVPVVSMPEADSSKVAFSYVAAAPAPWEATTVAEVSLPRADDIKTVSTGKRRPAKRSAPSAI
jgi:membrane glycosyltransferase